MRIEVRYREPLSLEIEGVVDTFDLILLALARYNLNFAVLFLLFKLRYATELKIGTHNLPST